MAWGTVPAYFPSIETLARQSHLHRVTVIRCLDSLKQKGLLKWISGRRKKSGRVLSNLYKLTLPKPASKRKETVLSEFWEDVDNSPSRVAQRYGYPLHSATPHSCTALPLPLHSATLSYIEHPKKIPVIITRRLTRRAGKRRVVVALTWKEPVGGSIPRFTRTNTTVYSDQYHGLLGSIPR